MITVILVIHLIVTLALVGAILLQRSEGGALGIGSSSSSGALFTARGAGNALTRATAILATIFFITSITLTILSVRSEKPGSVFDQVNGTGGAVQAPAAPAKPAAPAAPSGPKVPVKP